MMQEDIEQIIKDQPELWDENLEKQKEKDKGKGKEKETVPETRKDQEKEKEKKESKGKEEKIVPEKDKEETDKSKTSIGEKQPRTTDTGSSPRMKKKSSKPTFQTVLQEEDFEGIADRVYGTMSESLTVITTVPEALKQTIETQLTELKTLMSHTKIGGYLIYSTKCSHRSKRKSTQARHSHTN